MGAPYIYDISHLRVNIEVYVFIYVYTYIHIYIYISPTHIYVCVCIYVYIYASNRNEYQEYFLGGGQRRPVHRADNLTTFMRWRRMEKIGWTDHVRNEDILLESRSRGISYMKYVNGRKTGLVTFCVETAF